MLSSTLERATPSRSLSQSEWHEIVKDPSTLLIITALRSRTSQSLESFFQKMPIELKSVAEKVVVHLEMRGDIEVKNGFVTLLNQAFFNVYDTNTLASFLPSLNYDATKIALRKGSTGKKGNSYRFIAIPRNEANLKKIKEASDRYLAELAAISASELGDSDEEFSIQLVSFINAEIKMEDLV